MSANDLQYIDEVCSKEKQNMKTIAAITKSAQERFNKIGASLNSINASVEIKQMKSEAKDMTDKNYGQLSQTLLNLGKEKSLNPDFSLDDDIMYEVKTLTDKLLDKINRAEYNIKGINTRTQEGHARAQATIENTIKNVSILYASIETIGKELKIANQSYSKNGNDPRTYMEFENKLADIARLNQIVVPKLENHILERAEDVLKYQKLHEDQKTHNVLKPTLSDRFKHAVFESIVAKQISQQKSHENAEQSRADECIS